MRQHKSKNAKNLDYRLKTINEDFEVTEVPLLPRFSKTGKYTYIWIQKSGFSTFDAQDIIRDFFKLKNEDINVEGLKDEDGITAQILSLKKVLNSSQVALFNKKNLTPSSYIKIERIMGYGDTPVAEKMLHANSFNLVVRNVHETIAEQVLKFCKNNKFVSFINYYDSQRFGMTGGPYKTHLIGKAIIDQDWKEAYKQFKLSGNKGLSENTIPSKKSTQDDFRDFFLTINPKKVNFFLSSYDSYLWNREVSKVLAENCKGSIDYFENVGDLFIPYGNIFKAPNIVSCAGHRLENDQKISKKDNTRCAITTTAVYVLDIADDEMNKGKKKIKLTFLLPTGSYATMCVRQLICKATE